MSDASKARSTRALWLPAGLLLALMAVEGGAHLLARPDAVVATRSGWEDRAPMARPRWNPTAAVVDGAIYVIGGQGETAPYPSLDGVERYDPATDTWEPRSPMPTSRWGAMAAVVDGRVHVFGGHTGTFANGFTTTDRTEIYDPRSDRWSAGAPMPTARGWGGAAVVGDSIWVFGGYSRDDDQVHTAVEIYLPGEDRWVEAPPMPAPRFTFMTAQLDGEIYLVGGWGSDRVQAFDPAAAEWSDRAPMPTPRGGAAAGTFRGRIYVAGGRGGTSDAFEAYDPIRDRWDALASLPTAREGLVGEVLGDAFYAIGGSVPLPLGGTPYYALNRRIRLPQP